MKECLLIYKLYTTRKRSVFTFTSLSHLRTLLAAANPFYRRGNCHQTTFFKFRSRLCQATDMNVSVNVHRQFISFPPKQRSAVFI